MALLLVAQIKGKQPKLYRVEETGGIVPVNEGLVVTGSEAAEALVRYLVSLYCINYLTSVYAMRVIAVHLIVSAVKFASFCGGSPQIVCLADNGAHWEHIYGDATPGHDPLADIYNQIPFILEACAKGNADDLKNHLNELQAEFQKVMETRKKHQEACQVYPDLRDWVW